VLSSLWVIAGVGPFLYSVLSPTDDLWAIVHGLEGREAPPAKAVDIVREVIESAGQLRRAVHVGHFASSFFFVLYKESHAESHTRSRTEDCYIAWFQRIPKPILLVVRSYRMDGVLQGYEIGSGDAIRYLIRGYGPPFVAWMVSFYLLRRRRSPYLSE
jgi:hypothetical protein